MKKFAAILSVLLCLALCGAFLSACGGGGDGMVYFVTFNYNYEGAPAAQVSNVVSGNMVEEPSAPAREGYVFDAWCTDAAGTTEFDFATPITADTTLYARWGDDENYVTVTFDLSAVEAENVEYRVAKGAFMEEPEIIVPGWECTNWYTDEGLTNRWLWGLAVNEDMTLYGAWRQQYTFEAEYCAGIRTMVGAGFSGTTSGLNMIERDTLNKGASNDFYVTYLYRSGLGLTFTIDAASDVAGATMYLRLSTQYMDIDLNSSQFEVRVTYEDGTSATYDYPTISIDSLGIGSSSEKAEFRDYLITNMLVLHEGANTITLTVINSGITMGTMTAYAPIIDCMKISTDADLTWTTDCDETNIVGK